MEHGTTNTYNYHKCRCAACKRAINDQVKARYQKRLEQVWELKNKPCVDCKRKFKPWQMQFDHRGEDVKVNRVSQMITHSWQKILDEIAKCDLVCANCHADRSYLRAKSAQQNSKTVEELQDTQSDGDK